MSDKREDYISWDEYFMAVAQLAGMRSKDPHTQVGACIVSEDNKILSMGIQRFSREAARTTSSRGERQVKIRWKTSIFTQRTVN